MSTCARQMASCASTTVCWSVGASGKPPLEEGINPAFFRKVFESSLRYRIYWQAAFPPKDLDVEYAEDVLEPIELTQDILG